MSHDGSSPEDAFAGSAVADGNRMHAIIAAFDAALGTALLALPERLAALQR